MARRPSGPNVRGPLMTAPGPLQYVADTQLAGRDSVVSPNRGSRASRPCVDHRRTCACFGKVSAEASHLRARDLTVPKQSVGGCYSVRVAATEAVCARDLFPLGCCAPRVWPHQTRDRGLSAVKLARAVRRWLMRGPLHPRRAGRGRLRAYSLTLTSRSGEQLETLEKLDLLLVTIARRRQSVSVLGSLDRAKDTGRWHVHVLALVPPGVEGKWISGCWRRLWPAGDERPVAGAQHVRTLATSGRALRNDLERVLAHHLGYARDGQRIADLPPWQDRVRVCGAFIRIWKRVSGLDGAPVGLPTPIPRQRRSRRGKTSTQPSLSLTKWRLGVDCAMCGRGLQKGSRRGTRYCGPPCRSAASRVLMRLVRGFSTASQADVRRRVRAVEAQGIVRRHAIRIVQAEIGARRVGRLSAPQVSIRALRCRCGAPLPKRVDARTCGRPACRMYLARRRKREALAQIHMNILLEVLLRRFGRAGVVSQTILHGIGASLRIPRRTRARLMDELVEDGAAERRPDAFQLLGPDAASDIDARFTELINPHHSTEQQEKA